MQKSPLDIPPGLVVPLKNRHEWAVRAGKEATYTPPSLFENGHYPHLYLWDSCFSAMAYARHAFVREAVEEIYSILDVQDQKSGFIPNMNYAPFGTRLDPERWLFMDRSKGSDYTQPPLLAKATAECFDAFCRRGEESEGLLFLSDVYINLKNFYGYFSDPGNHRQNSAEDPLVGVIHPHETGRDSDPTFDFIKWRLPRNGIETPAWKENANTILDYFGALTQNVKNRMKNWEVERIREQFWENDVMYNCIYADNLGLMAKIAARLGENDDAVSFNEKSSAVKKQIINTMWDSEARQGSGAFFALHRDGSKNPEISISNLFPLLITEISEVQLRSLLTLIQKSFNTPYMFPTVPTDSPEFNPHYKEKGIMWRGPVWLWMNDQLAEGLERQSSRQELDIELRRYCHSLAARVWFTSKTLAQKGYEHYDPITGEGQRNRQFSANAIGYLAIQKGELAYR